jgi:hypothetical protein
MQTAAAAAAAAAAGCHRYDGGESCLLQFNRNLPGDVLCVAQRLCCPHFYLLCGLMVHKHANKPHPQTKLVDIRVTNNPKANPTKTNKPTKPNKTRK